MLYAVHCCVRGKKHIEIIIIKSGRDGREVDIDMLESLSDELTVVTYPPAPAQMFSFGVRCIVTQHTDNVAVHTQDQNFIMF